MTVALRVVAGMLVRRGRVLVARRGPAMDLAGCWEFPGGKIEAGETAAMALVRELDEELGVAARALRHLATSEFRSADGRLIRLEGWLADPGPVAPEAREHDAIAWRLPEEIDRATLAPADGPLLDALVDHLGVSIDRGFCEGGFGVGDSDDGDFAERGPTERGPTERGPTERGPTECGPTDPSRSRIAGSNAPVAAVAGPDVVAANHSGTHRGP